MIIKKLLLFFLILGFLISAYSSLPIPRPGYLGYYTWNGTIWCTSRSSCLHEVGHKLDDHAGWISSSPEFVKVMEEFTPTRTRMSNGKYDTYALKELYAEIFAWSGGNANNLPETFRKFYNWTLAQQYIIEYVK